MSATGFFLRCAGTLAAALAALLSCREPEVISPQQQPRVPPPAAARWYDAWASNEGVLTPAGRIVLLHGERALVDAAGNVTRARKASPERLSGLALIPTRTGGTLIGFDDRGIYRFDEPLGEGTFIAGGEWIREVGSAPELIRVYVRGAFGDAWHWLDLQGKPASFSLPAVTWSAFVDMQRGVVSTPHAGLLVTSDGGATWKQVKGDGTAPEQDPEQWEATSRARQDEHDAGDGVLRVARSSVVDPATGVVSPFKAPTEPPLVRWLRGTRAAPLEAAARGGVPAGNDRAVVLGGGMLMTVELSTGEPTSFVEVRPEDAGLFAARRVWKGALIGTDALFFDEPPRWTTGNHPTPPMSLFKASSPLGSGPPTLLFTFERRAPVSASGSGGVSVEAACPKRESSPMGDVCALQPDGSWRNHALPGKGLVGAASDGGYFLGRIENETIAVERVGPAGNATTWATVALPGAFRLESLDEVDADTLHAFAVLTSGDGALASIRMRRGAAPVVGYFGFGRAHGFRGRGALVDLEHLNVTLDGGAHWQTWPVPNRAFQFYHFVSEVGIATGFRFPAGGGFRIGWGDSAPFELRSRPSPDVTLRGPSSWAVTCEPKSGGAPRPSVPPGALAWSWPVSVLPASADRVELAARVDVVKMGDKHSWTFQWVDGTAVPAKVFRVTGYGPATGDQLRIAFATATDGQVFFQLRAREQSWNARVVGSRIEWVSAEEGEGDVERAAIGPDGAVAFATNIGGVGRALWAWPKGDAPRQVASLVNAPTALSAPAQGEIMLLYAVGDETAMHRVTFDRNTKLAPLDVSGGVRAPLSLRTPTALPRCDAKSAGRRVRAVGTARGAVKGSSRSEPEGWSGAFTLRVTDKQACIDAMELRRHETSIRADFVRNKAEEDDGVVVRDLECGSSPSR